MADADANGKAFGKHTGIVPPISQIAHVCEMGRYDACMSIMNDFALV